MIVLTAFAGGVGAAARFVVDGLGRERLPGPWAIVVVNIVGSFALGLLTGVGLGEPCATALGVGLLGGWTTFSTASHDTLDLLRDGRPGRAAAHAVGTLLLSVGASALGLALT
jgi:CrcB protein